MQSGLSIGRSALLGKIGGFFLRLFDEEIERPLDFTPKELLPLLAQGTRFLGITRRASEFEDLVDLVHLDVDFLERIKR